MTCFRKKAVVFVIVVLAVALTLGTAHARVSVTLSLDRTQTTTGDSVTLVVSVSGARSSDQEPTIKNLSHFYVSSGGTASRVQIINGQMEASVDYTYFLQPKRTGTFTIGPATVVLDGRTYTSNTVTLEVSRKRQSDGQDKGPVFLETSLSSPKTYVEQQVIYTLRLVRRIKVSDVSLNLPDTEGLTFKKLGEVTEYRSMRQGRPYEVLEVRYAVIPTRPGEKAVGPTTMTMTVYEPSSRRRSGLLRNPFFDDPFFSMSTGRPITISSEPLKLEALPLPAAGRPADFTGLVGVFRINATLAPAQIKAGESATLTVHVSGHGNVSRIPDLHLPENPDLKVYADEPVVEAIPDKEGLGGSKTMKWALVPQKAGTYRIASLGLSYFDTASGTYRRLKTAAFSLSVQPGAQTPALQAGGTKPAPESRTAEKKEITPVGHDILPIHTAASRLNPAGQRCPDAQTLWLVLLGPWLCYGLGLLGIRAGKRSRRSQAATRAKKAARVLIKDTRREELTANDFLEAARHYFNDRFELGLGSLTAHEAQRILVSRGARPETADGFARLLKEAENTIYTGHGKQRFEAAAQIATLVRTLEKEMR